MGLEIIKIESGYIKVPGSVFQKLTYELFVKYLEKKYMLIFEKKSFDQIPLYNRSGEMDYLVECLQREPDFLRVVEKFLDSRINSGWYDVVFDLRTLQVQLVIRDQGVSKDDNLKLKELDEKLRDPSIGLGWNDTVYNLDILPDIPHVQEGYGLDDKVFKVGKFQIRENIAERWKLSSVRKANNNNLLLTFNHPAMQRDVYFEISSSVFVKEMNGALIDGEDFSKFIEEFNKKNNLRLRFRMASDLVNQKFKTDRLPVTLTEQNWNDFFEDPTCFVMRIFQNLAATVI